MKTVGDIRAEFLGFFEKNGHEIVASSSLVPQNDPTLMFTNAGMNQFKDVFTGKEKRDYTRATTSQKCVRAGGKHNDLENVGYTARHQTFFEMLGNFSFGDYFKEEAIAFAWELCTKNFGLSPEKLLVTVHSSDEEAAGIWKKVTGFSDDKIIRIPTSDNFWSMGDTGPCGPCTEIFYDHGDHIPGGPPGSPDEDGDRFIEIWNNVFMQYEQLADGTRIDLPAQSVDTGMGLERMSAILQNGHSNYDIDIFQTLIKHISDIVSEKESASHRVIADHLRASAFLIADGVLPSNEGRGYVLRRIMRRGMRHAHLLGASEPLMYKLVPTLRGLMADAFPELNRADSLITETLKSEEERFKTTLDRGLKILDEEVSKLSGNTFPGDVAFKLYDTYGFPLDLTQDALKSQGLEVDVAAFNENMEAQKAAARAAWSGSGDTGTEKLWFDIADEIGTTEFLGYEADKTEAEIRALVQDGERVDALKKGDKGIILTNQTPFYAEAGGQIGDKGMISKDGAVFKVVDTKKQVGQLWLHIGEVESGTFGAKDAVQMIADGRRRDAIRANHSATHLLHAALREKLGDHITQKGSLVAPDRLRFDVSHPKQITAEELQIIEDRVNGEIRANTEVVTRLMDRDAAIEAGAMALFGEKYDDEVRVLTMGRDNPETGLPFSVELCGGTHVRRTGDIGLIKIVGESAVSAGVRRIEALTGEGALAYFSEQEAIIKHLSQQLRASPAELESRLEALLAERKKADQEISNLRKKLATGGASSAQGSDDVKKIGEIAFKSLVVQDVPAKDLKPMADEMKRAIGSGVVTLIATSEGKVSIVVAVTDDLTSQINAVDLVRIGAEALGGKGGGGRPDMAQAGGSNPDAANDAVAQIEKNIAG